MQTWWKHWFYVLYENWYRTLALFKIYIKAHKSKYGWSKTRGKEERDSFTVLRKSNHTKKMLGYKGKLKTGMKEVDEPGLVQNYYIIVCFFCNRTVHIGVFINFCLL